MYFEEVKTGESPVQYVMIITGEEKLMSNGQEALTILTLQKHPSHLYRYVNVLWY